MTPIAFYVLKYDDRYCRFGSYRTVTFVDTPFKASTFQREADARKRTEKHHYSDTGFDVQSGIIGPGEFSIMKIEVVQWGEDDVS